MRIIIRYSLIKYIKRINQYAEKVIAAERTRSSPWTQRTLDIANLLEYSSAELLEKLDDTYSARNILEDLQKLLNKVSNYLEQGTETFETNSSFHEYARDMILTINDFKKEFEDFQKFYQAVKALDKKNLTEWQILLFNIQFNQYKSDSLSLGTNAFDKFDFNEDDVGQFFSALKENRFVKKMKLDFSNNTLATSAIMEILKCEGLEALEITSAFQKLELLGASHFREISIKDNSLNDEIVKKLAVNPNLVAIHLTSENISEEGLIALCQNPSIKEVTITSNAITDEGLIRALTALQESNIKKLTLNSNSITDEGIKAFAKNECLLELWVHSDCISENSKELFKRNNTLANLQLYGMQIKSPGIQHFAPISMESHPNREYVKQYLLNLDDVKFVEIAREKQYVQLVLADEELSKKFNEAAIDTRKQTYKRSCAARSIMLILNKLGLIPDIEVSRRKELEIYSQIWSDTGEIADLSLVQAYLTRYNLGVIVVEDKAYSAMFLENPKIKELYTNTFQNPKNPIKIATKSLAEILQNNKDKDAYCLLVTMPGKNNDSRDLGHVVLLIREENRFCILDPGNGRNVFKDSLEEVLEELENRNYSGIAIEIQPPINTLLQAPKRYGFYVPAQSQRFIEKRNENLSKCFMQ